MKMDMEHWWNDTDRGKPKYCSIDTLSTTNMSWNDLESNTRLRGEKLTTNRLRHDTA
jgi:hypothetical protein